MMSGSTSEFIFRNYAGQFLNSIYLLGLATAIKFTKDWMLQRQQLQEKERQHRRKRRRRLSSEPDSQHAARRGNPAQSRYVQRDGRSRWLNAARAQVVAELRGLGYQPATFVHPSSQVSPEAKLGAHVRVVAFDHPGTGELTHIPLTVDSTQIVDGLAAYARTLTTGKVGHLGVSFGGYFAAHSSLTQVVDAAVVIGGPVTTASFGMEHLRQLMYGMEGIVGNALGFTSIPTHEELLARAQAIAMDDLVAKGTNCPTLAINGDNDVHVPLADVELWRGRPNTDVVLIPGGTHCAMNKLDQLLPAVTGWLATALH